MYKIAISPEEIESLPLTSFTGEITVVGGIGKNFWKAIEYLKKQKMLGFDTETKPSFDNRSKHNGVALLQLSGEDKAYLFRVQKIALMRLVYRLLANPEIIKVGAACGDDIRGLQRYAKFDGRSFVDLQRIVGDYGIRDKSVKKMAAIILGIRISKTQQLSNWEAEELSEAQKRYAATDAWVCREMYLKLLQSEKHPLTAEERIPPQQLEQQRQAAERRAARRAEQEEQERRRRNNRNRRRRQRRRRKKQLTDGSQTISEKG